jgi:hypothetical protein
MIAFMAPLDDLYDDSSPESAAPKSFAETPTTDDGLMDDWEYEDHVNRLRRNQTIIIVVIGIIEFLVLGAIIQHAVVYRYRTLAAIAGLALLIWSCNRIGNWFESQPISRRRS